MFNNNNKYISNTELTFGNEYYIMNNYYDDCICNIFGGFFKYRYIDGSEYGFKIIKHEK